MGIFDKILGGKGGAETGEVPNIDEYIETPGDAAMPQADFYVRSIDLRNDGDVELAVKELGEKNIVILKVLPLSKQPNRLKTIIQKLKAYVTKIDGDIASLTPDMVMLTPARVKIVKSKPKPVKPQ